MKTQSIQNVTNATRVLDLASLIIAFTISAWLAGADARNMPFEEMLAIRVKIQNIFLFAGLVAIWSVILWRFNLYQTHHVYRSIWRDAKDLLVAVTCCVALLGIGRLLFRIQLVGPEFLIDFWALTLGFAIAHRVAIRLALLQLRRKGHNLRHLLIVGTSRRAVKAARRIQSVPELGYHFVGFVDEDWSGSEAVRREGHAVVSDFAGFPDFIAKNVIDEVLVSIPVKSFYEPCSKILAQCEEQGITVRFIPDVFTPTLGRSYVERFDDHLVLTIDTGGMRGGAVAVKRVIDLTVAAALLTALLPLILAITLLIKLRSPGPVFFVQDRMGLNKRRFHLYKFRTMLPDAEARIAELEHLNEVRGPVFKIRNDPRVTPIGRFLRKTSLDELPQLFNVLKGEMSLVGPRPLPVRDYQSFSTAWHRRRFSVKPGITCLWQVMGRNSIPFERWMELDMQYIDQWSLLLDLQILLKTIPAVMKGSGAS
jgi:exopolysaccharide biosynthesis polyprenyl glycosylphosphotransferase